LARGKLISSNGKLSLIIVARQFMRIINLNPATDIGASAWFAEIEGHRLLLDAGTHPKREGRDSLPLYKLIAKEDVEAIALTHCHTNMSALCRSRYAIFPKPTC